MGKRDCEPLRSLKKCIYNFFEDNLKLAILKAFDNYHKYYIRACEELKIDFDVVDFIAPDWMDRISRINYDGFLCRPPSKFQERKTMFDERLFILNKLMGKRIYPTYEELFLYENKRLTSYWLDLHKFPHPETKVFYLKQDFHNFLRTKAEYPFVVKSNIGSTAKGVKIVYNQWQARRLAYRYFGLIHPKLVKGYTAITTGRIIPFVSLGSREKHFMIIQKFEKINWEWRIVKIGDSYFGHKKLLKGKFASGSHLKGWDRPPDELLFLIKDICEAGNFVSMDADIFETEDGRFLINELQSLFGQKTKHLMYVDNKPGRFVFNNGQFKFEEGEFNQHQSYLLRVKHFIKILESKEGETKNEN